MVVGRRGFCWLRAPVGQGAPRHRKLEPFREVEVKVEFEAAVTGELEPIRKVKVFRELETAARTRELETVRELEPTTRTRKIEVLRELEPFREFETETAAATRTREPLTGTMVIASVSVAIMLTAVGKRAIAADPAVVAKHGRAHEPAIVT
jgi:hypothetical protein